MTYQHRRASLLEAIKSPLLNSDHQTNLPSTAPTANNKNKNNNSLFSDPFELNNSIWNNNSNNITTSNTSNANMEAAYTSNRRASDMYQTYTSQNNNMTNNNDNTQDAVNWTGNNVYSPRKFSLDSYTSTLPSFNNDAISHVNNSNNNNNVTNMNMNNMNMGLSNMNMNDNGYYNEQGALSPPQSQNQQIINESTPQLLQSYKQLDFYFEQDPHQRISISVDSLNTTNFESLIMNSDGQSITLPKFQNTNSLPSQQLILVSFKCGRIDVFYLPENSSLILKIGDLVIVEADRGKDLGKIVKLDLSIDEARLLKYLQFMEQQAALNSFSGPSSSSSGNNNVTTPPSSIGNSSSHNNSNSNNSNSGNASGNGNVPTLHFPKPILRFAYPQEVLQLLTKLSDEEKAKKICVFKIDSIPTLNSNSTSMNQITGNMQIIDAEYQFDRRKLTFYYAAKHRIDFRDLVRDLFRVYKTRIWMCAVNTTNMNNQSPSLTSLEIVDSNHSFGGFEFNQNIWNTNSISNYLQNNNNSIGSSPPQSYNNFQPSSPTFSGQNYNNNNNVNENYQYQQQTSLNSNNFINNNNYNNNGNSYLSNGIQQFSPKSGNNGFGSTFEDQQSHYQNPGYFGMSPQTSNYVSNSIWN